MLFVNLKRQIDTFKVGLHKLKGKIDSIVEYLETLLFTSSLQNNVNLIKIEVSVFG